MPTYVVTRKDTGAFAYEYTADAPVEWAGLEFATHDHVEQPPPGASPEPVLAPERWQISKLAFRSRFTPAERAALVLTARQNSATGASVQAYLDDVQAAAFIDLKRADTRAGVLGLEQAGMIAAGRAAVILDTLPTDVELYRG